MKVKTCTWDWDLLQDKATSGLKTSYWRKEFHTFLSTSNRAEDKFLLLPSSKKNRKQICMVVMSWSSMNGRGLEGIRNRILLYTPIHTQLLWKRNWRGTYRPLVVQWKWMKMFCKGTSLRDRGYTVWYFFLYLYLYIPNKHLLRPTLRRGRLLESLRYNSSFLRSPLS